MKVLIGASSKITQETCWCYCGNQKALKGADDVLQKNIVAKETHEIKMILERQKEVEEGFASNTDALSRIDKELE